MNQSRSAKPELEQDMGLLPAALVLRRLAAPLLSLSLGLRFFPGGNRVADAGARQERGAVLVEARDRAAEAPGDPKGPGNTHPTRPRQIAARPSAALQALAAPGRS